MATFTKLDCFTENLAEKIHDLSANTLKFALTNTAPTANNSILSNITQITAENGYTAGGKQATLTSSVQTAGVYKLIVGDVVFTANGGNVGPLRYVVFYDDTPTTPVDPLIAWFDYGSSITLLTGETLTVDADAAAGILTIT
jgi:hypothetical protein